MKQKPRLLAVVLAGGVLILAGVVLLSIFVIYPNTRAGQFARANALLADDPAGAFDAFDRLGNYRDAQDRARQIQADIFASRTAETMEFGDRDWLVLEERGDNTLLLLQYVLPARVYHEAMMDITWEYSNIRQYLNSTFLNGFDEADRARIIETALFNRDSVDYGTYGGGDTLDHVFLLSLAEANLYFANAEDRIGRVDTRGSNRTWWLRSPGLYPYLAATVVTDGTLGLTGSPVDGAWGMRYVRPALWVAAD